jgi:hypothetical protein
LEKEGKPHEAVSFYMKAYKLKPELEDEEVAQEVLRKSVAKVRSILIKIVCCG